MPKIRGVKPDLWTDEDFVELSPYARLLWIGLWNHACDNGHLQDKSKQIKMRVLPTDEVNCAELLREIEARGLIERADGWITIPNLTHHQKPHKRWYVTCEKADCEMPEGASYGYSKPETTVEQPLSNREQPLSNGGSTVDVDVDVDGELMVSGVDAPAPASTTKTNARRKRPATRLPDDWKPSEQHWEKRHDAIDVAREAQAFRLHAEANDRRQANWNAAFSQWLLNARPTASNVRQIHGSDTPAEWRRREMPAPPADVADDPQRYAQWLADWRASGDA